jgi:hypothetical protein
MGDHMAELVAALLTLTAGIEQQIEGEARLRKSLRWISE